MKVASKNKKKSRKRSQLTPTRRGFHPGQERKRQLCQQGMAATTGPPPGPEEEAVEHLQMELADNLLKVQQVQLDLRGQDPSAPSRAASQAGWGCTRETRL